MPTTPKPPLGSLVGRTFTVKPARHHGTARTPWAIYERSANMDWLVLDFLTATEAEGLGRKLESMGATITRETL